MGAEAARIDALAAREVWKAPGVPDRIGVTEDNVAHCSWSQKYTPDLEAYLDKFLLGKTDGNPTEFLRSNYRFGYQEMDPLDCAGTEIALCLAKNWHSLLSGGEE